MYIWSRLFKRGVKGVTGIQEGENYKVERKLTKDGNSGKIAIPPITIEELGLKDGVWLEKRGSKLIITRRKK